MAASACRNLSVAVRPHLLGGNGFDEYATPPGRPLDAGSTEPLHLQLRGQLHTQIMSHSLPPGTPLPSEAQLQVRYGVSRSVVR